MPARADYGMAKQEAKGYRDQGYKMQMEGNISGAREMYEKAAAMDPQYAEVHNDLGVVYESLNQIDRAISMYKKALEINNNYLPAYANLGFAYEKKGDITNAGLYWKKRYDLGQSGEYWREVARQHLLRLGTNPEVATTHLEDQARVLSRDMVAAREQTRLKNLEEAKIHYNLGCSILTKGDYGDAIKEFDAARDLKPEDADLAMRIEEFRTKAVQLLHKIQAKASAEAALGDIQAENYQAAGTKLRESLDALEGVPKKADIQLNNSQK